MDELIDFFGGFLVQQQEKKWMKIVVDRMEVSLNF